MYHQLLSSKGFDPPKAAEVATKYGSFLLLMSVQTTYSKRPQLLSRISNDLVSCRCDHCECILARQKMYLRRILGRGSTEEGAGEFLGRALTT